MFVSGGSDLKSLYSNSSFSYDLTLACPTVFERRLVLSIISPLQLSLEQIRCTATAVMKKEMLQWWVIYFCVEQKTVRCKRRAEFLLEPCVSILFTQGCVMKRYPEVLMLLLKRFMFDYNSWTNVKNNCHVDIPCTLQIPNVSKKYWYDLYLFQIFILKYLFHLRVSIIGFMNFMLLWTILEAWGMDTTVQR